MAALFMLALIGAVIWSIRTGIYGNGPMKRWFIWTSYIGAFFLFARTVIAVMFFRYEKVSKDALLAFFGNYALLFFGLFAAPMLLLSALDEYIANVPFIGVLKFVYTYLIGVFTTYRFITVLEKYDSK